jgi:UDP-N-acetylglucosamine transferase subunit ALG13
MIFVTVGAQMPFDRLISAVDTWAALRGRTDVYAQIGASSYIAKSIDTTQFMDPDEFRRMVEEAQLIVAHAGMGTIITALERGKPILVMPRRGDLRETRNDHQLGTVKKLLVDGRVEVALDEGDLIYKLDNYEAFKPAEKIEAIASPRLISTIRTFIESGAARYG